MVLQLLARSIRPIASAAITSPPEESSNTAHELSFVPAKAALNLSGEAVPISPRKVIMLEIGE